MIWGMGSVGAAIGESTGESALDAVRLRLVASFVEESAADQARHAIGRASAGLAGLFDVDVSALDAVELRVWLEEVEGLRRTAAAASAAPGSRWPQTTVNVLIVDDTFETHLRGETVDLRPIPRRRGAHPDRASVASRRRHQRRPDRPHPPRRRRRLGHRHRPRTPTTPVSRVITRGGDAAAHDLCVDRLRPAHCVVRRRSLRVLESRRRDRAQKRWRTLRLPQRPRGTRLPGLLATTTAPGTSSTLRATRSSERSAGDVLVSGLTRLGHALLDQLGHFGAVDRLAIEQRLGDQLEAPLVTAEDVARAGSPGW